MKTRWVSLRTQVTIIHLVVSMVVVFRVLSADPLRVNEPGLFWGLLLIIVLFPTDLLLLLFDYRPVSIVGEVAVYGVVMITNSFLCGFVVARIADWLHKRKGEFTAATELRNDKPESNDGN